METFLSFLAVTVLVIYVAGWLGRVLLRRWIVRKQREMQERFAQGAGARGQYGRRADTRREGEVSVQRTAADGKNVSRSVGQYVEFEEVEEMETDGEGGGR